MPLAAVFKGTRVLAHELSGSEWLELKAVYKRSDLVMSCGEPAVPRTSKLKRQFFAHKAGAVCHWHKITAESPQHLEAKQVINRVACADGWTSTIEHRAEDGTWIADVFAERDGRRIAMEVQWSPQNSAEFKRRQDRYDAARVGCLWFVHQRNKAAAAEAGVPHLVFARRDSTDHVLAREAFGEVKEHALDLVVQRALNGGFKRRLEARKQELVFGFLTHGCNLCLKTSTIYALRGVRVTTGCGKFATLQGPPFEHYPKERIESRLIAEIRLALPSGAAPLAPLEVFTAKNNEMSYLAYHCAHCSATFGSWYIGSHPPHDWAEVIIPSSDTVRIPDESLDQPHLCAKDGGDSCRRITARNPNYDCSWAEEPQSLKTDEPERGLEWEFRQFTESKIEMRFTALGGPDRTPRREGPPPNPLPVHDMTQEELRIALSNVYRALYSGYLMQKVRSRESLDLYDDSRELLGPDFPRP